MRSSVNRSVALRLALTLLTTTPDTDGLAVRLRRRVVQVALRNRKMVIAAPQAPDTMTDVAVPVVGAGVVIQVAPRGIHSMPLSICVKLEINANVKAETVSSRTGQPAQALACHHCRIQSVNIRAVAVQQTPRTHEPRVRRESGIQTSSSVWWRDGIKLAFQKISSSKLESEASPLP